jgi:hypothetical protein
MFVINLRFSCFDDSKTWAETAQLILDQPRRRASTNKKVNKLLKIPSWLLMAIAAPVGSHNQRPLVS